MKLIKDVMIIKLFLRHIYTHILCQYKKLVRKQVIHPYIGAATSAVSIEVDISVGSRVGVAV